MSSTSSGRPPAGGAVGEQVDAGGGGVLVAVLEYPCLEQAMLGGLDVTQCPIRRGGFVELVNINLSCTFGRSCWGA